MFTGIIRKIGVVRGAAASAAGKRLRIDAGELADRLGLGDSVAVEGACLTVATKSGSQVELDVVPETLSRTTLNGLRTNDRVNLEPALRVGDALDGHMVQGHVDGVAVLHNVRRDGGQYLMEFTCGGELTDEMVAKGSVAVSGVSLTLVSVGRGSFSAAIIPTTLEHTTLGGLRVGHKVNIETDVLGKYIRKYLPRPDQLTMEKLREAGFA